MSGRSGRIRPVSLPPDARRASRRDSGQSLIEFVLVLPLLLVIVFGIVEFANAWRHYQVITNVAREGARLAVVDHDEGAVRATIDEGLTRGGLDPDDASVTLLCEGGAGVCADGMTGAATQVDLDYPYAFRMVGPLAGLLCSGCGDSFGTVTLSTTSIMRTE